MTKRSLKDELAGMPFTSRLPGNTIDELAQIAQEESFSKGAILFREGEVVKDMFLIAEGHVALDMFVPGRGQERVLTLGPGDILAWSAIVGDDLATATCLALEPTRAVRFADEALIALCDKKP